MTTTYRSHPIPQVSEDRIAKNEGLPRGPEHVDVCAVCYRPLKAVGAYVHTAYGADAVHPEDVHLVDPAADSGMYALGSECAKKVPAAFRVKPTA